MIWWPPFRTAPSPTQCHFGAAPRSWLLRSNCPEPQTFIPHPVPFSPIAHSHLSILHTHITLELTPLSLHRASNRFIMSSRAIVARPELPRKKRFHRLTAVSRSSYNPRGRLTHVLSHPTRLVAGHLKPVLFDGTQQEWGCKI